MIGKHGSNLAHGENDSARAEHRWPLPGVGKPAGAPSMASLPQLGKIRITHAGRRGNSPLRQSHARAVHDREEMLYLPTAWKNHVYPQEAACMSLLSVCDP